MKQLYRHLLVYCITVGTLLCITSQVFAEVEWRPVRDVDLKEKPLDIAVSRVTGRSFEDFERLLKNELKKSDTPENKKQ